MNEPLPTKTVLHTAIRVDDISPSHWRLSIFQGLAYTDDDRPLSTLTRGLSGSITIDSAAAEPLITGFPGLVKISIIRDGETDDSTYPGWLVDLIRSLKPEGTASEQ